MKDVLIEFINWTHSRDTATSCPDAVKFQHIRRAFMSYFSAFMSYFRALMSRAFVLFQGIHVLFMKHSVVFYSICPFLLKRKLNPFSGCIINTYLD